MGKLRIKRRCNRICCFANYIQRIFSGCATWNNPQSASENVAGADFTLAVKAATNTVTIGVNKKLTNLGVRYIVIGNAD